ncbi:MAG: phosphatase PAP2 family protein [Sulfurovum sp.]|nr:phosphatase PAP2 family protein [Sulfurovum sp.]
MQKILIVLLLLYSNNYAKSNTELAGDILTLLIPSIGLGATLYTEDRNSSIEFLKAYGSTALVTHILKNTVKKQRPNNANSYTSFPSGHTSSAFSGASFIHRKYGIEYALPAYIGAIYTGYSRVKAEKHYTIDVIAGALVGIGFSWYFTSPYKNLQVIPTIGNNNYGIKVDYQW